MDAKHRDVKVNEGKMDDSEGPQNGWKQQFPLIPNAFLHIIYAMYWKLLGADVMERFGGDRIARDGAWSRT